LSSDVPRTDAPLHGSTVGERSTRLVRHLELPECLLSRKKARSIGLEPSLLHQWLKFPGSDTNSGLQFCAGDEIPCKALHDIAPASKTIKYVLGPQGLRVGR